MTPRSDYDFGVEGPVQAEVFVLWLNDETIEVTGPCGPEAWLIDIADEADPVETVTRMVNANIGRPIVVHSTSWRVARDGVVLSFVVVVDEALVTNESRPVRRTELARSKAMQASERIDTDQVVEHGLRHLAWLVREDPVVCRELPTDWARVLETYEPQPFRNLR